MSSEVKKLSAEEIRELAEACPDWVCPACAWPQEGPTEYNKRGYVLSKGWTESSVYDGYWNAPESLKLTRVRVFPLNDAYKIAAAMSSEVPVAPAVTRDAAIEELRFIKSYLGAVDQDADHAWMVKRIDRILQGKPPSPDQEPGGLFEQAGLEDPQAGDLGMSFEEVVSLGGFGEKK